MAKASMIQKELKRARTVKKFAIKRATLKSIIKVLKPPMRRNGMRSSNFKNYLVMQAHVGREVGAE